MRSLLRVGHELPATHRPELSTELFYRALFAAPKKDSVAGLRSLSNLGMAYSQRRMPVYAVRALTQAVTLDKALASVSKLRPLPYPPGFLSSPAPQPLRGSQQELREPSRPQGGAADGDSDTLSEADPFHGANDEDEAVCARAADPRAKRRQGAHDVAIDNGIVKAADYAWLHERPAEVILMYTEAVSIYVSVEGRKEAVQLRSWIAAARTRARGRVRGGAHGQSLSRTGAPLDPHACNPRATAHHCSARDTVAGPTPIAIHRRT